MWETGHNLRNMSLSHCVVTHICVQKIQVVSYFFIWHVFAYCLDIITTIAFCRVLQAFGITQLLILEWRNMATHSRQHFFCRSKQLYNQLCLSVCPSVTLCGLMSIWPIRFIFGTNIHFEMRRDQGRKIARSFEVFAMSTVGLWQLRDAAAIRSIDLHVFVEENFCLF